MNLDKLLLFSETGRPICGARVIGVPSRIPVTCGDYMLPRGGAFGPPILRNMAPVLHCPTCNLTIPLDQFRLYVHNHGLDKAQAWIDEHDALATPQMLPPQKSRRVYTGRNIHDAHTGVEEANAEAITSPTHVHVQKVRDIPARSIITDDQFHPGTDRIILFPSIEDLPAKLDAALGELLRRNLSAFSINCSLPSADEDSDQTAIIVIEAALLQTGEPEEPLPVK